MARTRTLCARCGGPKGAGRGRRFCQACTEAGAVYCPACQTVKARSDFYPAPSRSTGVTTYCKPCAVDRNRDARYKMPYGSLRRMYEEQGGRCAACGDGMTVDAAHVDHDHACCPKRAKSCGRCIRELLCSGCNVALGLLRDDPDRALALATYLLRHQGGESDRPC